jgi:H+/gluconate symporter-like permease
VWAVVTALAAAIVTVVAINWSRLPSLRATMDAGANASVLPALSVASLVGFGAVVAAMPAFSVVRDWVLGIGGGPLVSLAAATNVLAALTGSASGGLTNALDSLGGTYLALAMERGIDPSLLHRVAVIGSGTLDWRGPRLRFLPRPRRAARGRLTQWAFSASRLGSRCSSRWRSAAGAFCSWRRRFSPFAGEPLLAHWTQTFMGGTAHFLAQFFPLFLLGALFGKLIKPCDDPTEISIG